MRDSILYYPTIAIRDTNWLKAALLVWDKVYRIVPEGIRPEDDPSVRVAVDQGHVRAVALDGNDLQRTSEDFADMLDNFGPLPDGLSTPYARLHKDKIDERLYPKLTALAKEIDPDGFLQLPETLERGYMFYLADTVARRRGLAKGTDDDASWTVAAYMEHPGNFDDYTINPEATGYYTNAVITDVLPADLSNVSMKDVLEFAETHQDERTQFRMALGDFERSLAECENRDHAEQLVADFEMKLRAAADNFRKSMSFFNPRARYAVLVTGLSVATGVFGMLSSLADKYHGSMFEHFVISGSIMLGAVGAHLDYGKAKEVQRDQFIGSYLVDMNSRLGSKRGKLSRYASNLEELIND